MKAKAISSSEEESDCSSGDPEDIGNELAMFVKKFQKFTKKKGFRKSSRSSSRNDEASPNDHKKRTCHKCKKPGHYISECPQWDNEKKKKKSKEYDSDDKKKKKSSKSWLNRAATCLAQVCSRGAISPDWFDTSVMVKITSEEA